MAAPRTAIGVFADPRRSEQALDELHRSGILEDQIRILAADDDRSNPNAPPRVRDQADDDEPERLERLRQPGRTVVAVRGHDCYHEILAILRRHGAEEPA
ncbi:MAG: hypothetical protein U0836_21510 [Pirellulales bacterium]|mgnify:CR=1 FL=1